MISVAGLASGSHVAALYGSAESTNAQAATPTNYLIDKLYGPIGSAASDAARAEAGLLLNAAAGNGETLTDDDRARLVALVSRNTSISKNDAAASVDGKQADVRAKTRHAADVARKVACYTSLWIAFSLLFGGIIAIFAAISARTEDDRQSVDARLPPSIKPTLEFGNYGFDQKSPCEGQNQTECAKHR